MRIDESLTSQDLAPALERFWSLSGQKIDLMLKEYDPAQGSPVFTVAGKYSTRGWTEWTEGFYYGSAFLQFDATGEQRHADEARRLTIERMASHVSHTGVHDHEFNNLSTYGNWLRLQKEGRLPADQIEFCKLAQKVSGSVQASRWASTHGGEGDIYSFNGPQSLFVDTIRSCRIVMVAHALGHRLMGENDVATSLLERALQHIESTAQYSVFYEEGRDTYDEWGRTAHESVFNPNDGRFRCPNTQQGYSGFTTWTRGLSWAIGWVRRRTRIPRHLARVRLGAFGRQSQMARYDAKSSPCHLRLVHHQYVHGRDPVLGQWRSRSREFRRLA